MIPAGIAHSATSYTKAGSPPAAAHRRRVIQIPSAIPATYISPYTWTSSGPRWKPLAGGLGIDASGTAG
jgi:hypothetical protein